MHIEDDELVKKMKQKMEGRRDGGGSSVFADAPRMSTDAAAKPFEYQGNGRNSSRSTSPNHVDLGQEIG